MIVRDIMTTRLVTVAPDDTLAHAANLLRQHQFHHLPVARKVTVSASQQGVRGTFLSLEGLLTSHDIDLAAALSRDDARQQPWQERLVFEIMHQDIIRVTPSTGVAAAAQMMVERNLNYLPVVEYNQVEHKQTAMLVGLVTRSDLLNALSRAMGAFEPGMQLDIALPSGNVASLARMLQIASELRIAIRSIMAAPSDSGVPRVATLRLGTINPAPLLRRLQEEGIPYSFGRPLLEGNPLGEGCTNA